MLKTSDITDIGPGAQSTVQRGAFPVCFELSRRAITVIRTYEPFKISEGHAILTFLATMNTEIATPTQKRKRWFMTCIVEDFLQKCINVVNSTCDITPTENQGTAFTGKRTGNTR
ncbi:hypothetical protein HA402_001779 [Bradysia odoriphaga]|nr:hypothetical protein HA402_001779 [Bradysia odoriphaga]